MQKKGLFHKRIPTVIALVILLGIVGVSTLLVQSGIFYIGKAAPDSQPLNFSITNITDTSFTATFTTTGLVDAVVSIDDAGTGTALTLDDRDKKSGVINKYYSHHISIPNLQPERNYTFKLIVGGKEYESNAYSATTGKSISTPPPAQNPLFGRVLLPDGTIGSDSIVTVTTPTSGIISSITDERGEFILPTNSLRNKESDNYILLDPNTNLTITFYRQLASAVVNTTFSLAQNLPAITLQQQYKFTESDEKYSSGSSQFTFTDSTANGSAVSIRRPQEGEEFIDQRPVFSGTSFPNSKVNLVIPGVAQQEILARADGLWTFQPPDSIPQGDRTITINVVSGSGEILSDTKRFTIFPLGSQVTESATPSATPTTRPTTQPTLPPPTPTFSLQPTTLPTTSIVTPTIATISPTPLPTIYITPTSIPPINPPGAFENAAILTGFSVVLIISGVILLLVL